MFSKLQKCQQNDVSLMLLPVNVYLFKVVIKTLENGVEYVSS